MEITAIYVCFWHRYVEAWQEEFKSHMHANLDVCKHITVISLSDVSD